MAQTYIKHSNAAIKEGKSIGLKQFHRVSQIYAKLFSLHNLKYFCHTRHEFPEPETTNKHVPKLSPKGTVQKFLGAKRHSILYGNYSIPPNGHKMNWIFPKLSLKPQGSKMIDSPYVGPTGGPCLQSHCWVFV